MILASQKRVFDKQGLGFKSSKNQKYFKNYFVKNPQVNVLPLFVTFVEEEGTLVVPRQSLSSTCKMDPIQGFPPLTMPHKGHDPTTKLLVLLRPH